MTKNYILGINFGSKMRKKKNLGAKMQCTHDGRSDIFEWYNPEIGKSIGKMQ